MALAPGEARKDLSADALFESLRSRFASLPDPRSGEVEIPLADALMSAFAMFSLKDPSLLAFDHRRHNPKDNFRTIYGINRVPCDSQMRDILDPIDPANLRAPFREVFRRLQRGQVLKRFVYLDGHYLLSLDGTTYFSSSKIHCSSCLEKHHRNGSVTYSHQLLGPTLVHPGLKEVIPLAPEPIIQQDGQAKNDCERNATRRWLKRFRQEHPHLPVIVVEDALSANAPHLRDLREAGAHYIIGVKPGDHAFLFDHLRTLHEAGQMQVLTLEDPATGVVHHFRFCNGVPLNESNPDELVNVETVARIPGYRIMPPSPCAESWWSEPGLGRAAPAAGPAPVGPRSPAASEPGTPSSASCGSDGCHAPPRWTSRPAVARPRTPAPSPTPAPAAS